MYRSSKMNEGRVSILKSQKADLECLFPAAKDSIVKYLPPSMLKEVRLHKNHFWGLMEENDFIKLSKESAQSLEVYSSQMEVGFKESEQQNRPVECSLIRKNDKKVNVKLNFLSEKPSRDYLPNNKVEDTKIGTSPVLRTNRANLGE
jgi:hypothetical protein